MSARVNGCRTSHKRCVRVSELTWDYVATTLIDEYNARHAASGNNGRGKKGRNRRKDRSRRQGSGNTPRDTNQHHDSDSDDGSDLGNAARAIAAALRSVKSDRQSTDNGHHCDFCDRPGHTDDRCYLNPENPNNKLPPKVRQIMLSKSKVGKAATVDVEKRGSVTNGKSRKVEIAGYVAASVEKTTVDPPRDLCSYADSGATVHCFHSESVFVPGSLTECDTRTILLADKTSVTSSRSGDVIIPFENANVRLKGALYIPDLGYNLVSTGRLADNGIESNFRRRDVQLFLEEENFYVGCGKRDTESGMYTLPSFTAFHPNTISQLSTPNDTNK